MRGGERMNIEITTHSGDVDIIPIDEYDPQELIKQLNDEDVYAILIGENIYSRIDVKNIRVKKDDE